MKNRIVIKLKNGHIEHIMASGDTDIAVIQENTATGAKTTSFARLEPDFIFEVGKSHEAYMGRVRNWLEKEKF